MAMMDVTVPDIGDFDEVAVIEMLVKVGDSVKAEQSLITVESDKASMEIPCSHAGVVKELKVKEVSAMYSLTISMCYELQDQYKKLGKEKLSDWHAQADNFLGFMMNNFSTELVVMGARVALTTYNLPMVPGKMKNFDEFHKRFGKYIIAASGK
jgi:hypothetical protein